MHEASTKLHAAQPSRKCVVFLRVPVLQFLFCFCCCISSCQFFMPPHRAAAISESTDSQACTYLANNTHVFSSPPFFSLRLSPHGTPPTLGQPSCEAGLRPQQPLQPGQQPTRRMGLDGVRYFATGGENGVRRSPGLIAFPSESGFLAGSTCRRCGTIPNWAGS